MKPFGSYFGVITVQPPAADRLAQVAITSRGDGHLVKRVEMSLLFEELLKSQTALFE